MEPITIFALAIALFGTVHLVISIADHISKGIHNTGNQKQKRSDWYCFFKASDLLGTEKEPARKISDRQSSTLESQKLEQRQKQQANRPRLYM